MNTKICTKCHEEKPLSDFHKNKSTPDGYRYHCKSCDRQYQIEYCKREEVKQRRRVLNRKYIKNPKVRKSRNEYIKNYRKRPDVKERLDQYWRDDLNTNERKARTAVNNAVATGKLPSAKSLKCEDCGSSAEEYHHESYEQESWLDVIPLCKICHGRRHRID